VGEGKKEEKAGGFGLPAFREEGEDKEWNGARARGKEKVSSLF